MTTAIGIQIAGQGGPSGRSTPPASTHLKATNGFSLAGVSPAVPKPGGSVSLLRQAFEDALGMLNGKQNQPAPSSAAFSVTGPSSQQGDSHSRAPASSIGLVQEESSFPPSEINKAEVRSGSRNRYSSMRTAQPTLVAQAQLTPAGAAGKNARPAHQKEHRDPAKADAAGVASRQIPLLSNNAMVDGFLASIPEPAHAARPQPSAAPTTHAKQRDFTAQTNVASISAGPASDPGIGALDHGLPASGAGGGGTNQNGSLPQFNVSSTGAGQPGSGASIKGADISASSAPLRTHESTERIAHDESSPMGTAPAHLSPGGYTNSPQQLTPPVQQAESTVITQAAVDKSRIASAQNASLEGKPKRSGSDQSGRNPVPASGFTAAMPESVRVATPGPDSVAGRSEVSTVSQAFDALDANDASVAPVWTHAGANRAEAGYQDQQLGWVTVRAQTGADGIHATLVPDSASAAQALGNHLAGLNTYLAEHHMPVESLTMATAAGQQSSPGMEQGSGQSSGGETNQQRHSGEQAYSIGDIATTSKNSGITSAVPGSSAAPIIAPWNGGVYVSVIA